MNGHAPIFLRPQFECFTTLHGVHLAADANEYEDKTLPVVCDQAPSTGVLGASLLQRNATQLATQAQRELLWREMKVQSQTVRSVRLVT